MILGLDASTTTCGWALFDGVAVIDAGFIDISDVETNKEKSHLISSTLSVHPQFPFITEIKLEAALSGFMRGRTSQQIVIKLARFNAVLEYVLGVDFKVPVTLINANTARKKVLGKAFIKGMTAKAYVRQELPKKISNLKKFEQLNKRGDWNKKNEDMFDAIVIACS